MQTIAEGQYNYIEGLLQRLDNDTLNKSIVTVLNDLLNNTNLSEGKKKKIRKEINWFQDQYLDWEFAAKGYDGKKYKVYPLREFLVKMIDLFKYMEKTGFKGYVQSDKRYFLGSCGLHYLYYDIKLLRFLKEKDRKEHTHLTAEYLFHEVMESSPAGHQSLRLLQTILFPENYQGDTYLLRDAIREFIQGKIDSSPTRLYDLFQDTTGTASVDKGRCVIGDTLLPIFENGDCSLKPIIDVQPGDYVLSLNEETERIEPHRINALLDMGIKPVYKLTTTSGRTIKTTANHPYLTRHGWVKVSVLRVGDEIGMPNTIGKDTPIIRSNSEIMHVYDAYGDYFVKLVKKLWLALLQWFQKQSKFLQTWFTSFVNYLSIHKVKIKQVKYKIHPTVNAGILKTVLLKIFPKIVEAKIIVEAFIKNLTKFSLLLDVRFIMELCTALSCPFSNNNRFNLTMSSIFFGAEAEAAEVMPEGDILWDGIVSIEYIGYEHVYDIEVEGTHNFIGNGIFAHNTVVGGNRGGGASGTATMGLTNEVFGPWAGRSNGKLHLIGGPSEELALPGIIEIFKHDEFKNSWDIVVDFFGSFLGSRLFIVIMSLILGAGVTNLGVFIALNIIVFTLMHYDKDYQRGSLIGKLVLMLIAGVVFNMPFVFISSPLLALLCSIGAHFFWNLLVLIAVYAAGYMNWNSLKDFLMHFTATQDSSRLSRRGFLAGTAGLMLLDGTSCTGWRLRNMKSDVRKIYLKLEDAYKGMIESPQKEKVKEFLDKLASGERTGGDVFIFGMNEPVEDQKMAFIRIAGLKEEAVLSLADIAKSVNGEERDRIIEGMLRLFDRAVAGAGDDLTYLLLFQSLVRAFGILADPRGLDLISQALELEIGLRKYPNFALKYPGLYAPWALAMIAEDMSDIKRKNDIADRLIVIFNDRGLVKDYDLRLQCIRGLGSMKAVSAIGFLEELALGNDTNPYFRKEAIVALGKIANHNSIYTLIHLLERAEELDSVDLNLRKIVMEALGPLADRIDVLKQNRPEQIIQNITEGIGGSRKEEIKQWLEHLAFSENGIDEFWRIFYLYEIWLHKEEISPDRLVMRMRELREILGDDCLILIMPLYMEIFGRKGMGKPAYNRFKNRLRMASSSQSAFNTKAMKKALDIHPKNGSHTRSVFARVLLRGNIKDRVWKDNKVYIEDLRERGINCNKLFNLNNPAEVEAALRNYSGDRKDLSNNLVVSTGYSLSEFLSSRDLIEIYADELAEVMGRHGYGDNLKFVKGDGIEFKFAGRQREDFLLGEKCGDCLSPDADTFWSMSSYLTHPGYQMSGCLLLRNRMECPQLKMGTVP